MVKITLEFPTVDLAIVALGKLVPGKVARAAAAEPEPAADPVAPKPPRKGRSDAGKARGPRSETPPQGQAPGSDPKAAPAPANAEAGVSPQKGVAPTASGTTEPTTPGSTTPDKQGAATEEDAQKALEKLFESKPAPEDGIELARSVLAKFGVTRVRDLKAEQRADFVKAAEDELKAKK